jgi:hypothetical protein
VIGLVTDVSNCFNVKKRGKLEKNVIENVQLLPEDKEVLA